MEAILNALLMLTQSILVSVNKKLQTSIFFPGPFYFILIFSEHMVG